MKNALTVRYNNVIFRLTGSLFAAVFITLYGKSTGLLVAMKYPSFYLQVTLSFSVAFFLALLCHCSTTILDKHFDWLSKPVRRSGLQAVFGIMIPVLAAYYIMLLYFNYFDGRDIHASGYMLVYFPHTVYFIILLNLYYVIHNLILRLHNPGTTQVAATERSTLRSYAIISDAPGPANIHPHNPGYLLTDRTCAEDNRHSDTAAISTTAVPDTLPEGEGKQLIENICNICFFYRYNGRNRIVFQDGYSTITGLSLDRIEELLAMARLPETAPSFFRINRQVLLGSHAFDLSDRPLSTRHNQIDIHSRYLSPSKGITSELFKISRFNLAKFKRWVAGHQPVAAE